MGGNSGGGGTSRVLGGAAAGSALGGAPVVPFVAGGQGARNWEKAEERFGGRKTQATKDAEAAAREAVQNQYNASQGVYAQMKTADEALLSGMGRETGDYRRALQGLSDEATQQGQDARQLYTGTIQPRMRDIMDRSTQEAKSAMTLAEAGDPNNAVNQGWRDLYNKEGAAVRQQGQQDYGVLAALGAQASGQQFGAGMPMTAGAMGQIQAANMGQAGEAYARAQQRMHALHERGLEVGREESGRQYERGERARDRERFSVQDLQNADLTNAQLQAAYRGERAGYQGQGYGLGAGMQQLQHGLASAQGGRELQSIADLYGGQGALAQAQAQQGYAQSAAGQQMLGSVIGGGMTMGAAYLGGPAMAAGAGAAGAAGATAAPAPQQTAAAAPAGTYGQGGVTYQMSPGATPSYYNYGQPGQPQYGYPARPYA